MTNQKLRDENNALLRKIWATGHCDSALQTEIALLLDARVREIEKLQSAVEPPSTSDAEFLSLVGHCSNCSCQDCREFFKADARARVEPPADRKSALDEIVRISEEAGLYEDRPAKCANCGAPLYSGTCQCCATPVNRTGD